ncbi:hypothetical protein EJ110_NYTH22061 [Nymphaea thermarum]|nr:hypothetical protein EJ110_NYTH22061 [Nymphaea thermarum]
MVAFERMHPESEESDRGVTSFMSFMDALIDTAEDDVALETLWTIDRRDKYLPSAKRLRTSTSGVTFKKSEPETGVWVVRFDKGVLYLPELVLNEASEGMLMNMVAFERMHPQSERGVTSFMDALIDTEEDVSILGKAGIVTNNLGRNDAAANIFNKLGMVEIMHPFPHYIFK